MTPELTGKAQLMYDAKTFTMVVIAASWGAGNNRAVSTAMVSSFLNAAGKLGR